MEIGESKELYNIDKDPGQTKNIASQHPTQVAKMQAFYDQWWEELEPTFAETTELHSRARGSSRWSALTSHDWIGGPDSLESGAQPKQVSFEEGKEC
jgi:arylsulfatase B